MAGSAQLEQEFATFKGGQPSLSAEQRRLSQEAGVGGQEQALNKLTEQILSTEKLLEGVGKRVGSRARRLGGPITEGTRQQLTAVEEAPIAESLGRFGRAQESTQVGLAGARQNVLQKLGLIRAGRQDKMSDFIRRINNAREDERATQDAALRRELANLGLGGGDGGGGAETFLSQEGSANVGASQALRARIRARQRRGTSAGGRAVRGGVGSGRSTRGSSLSRLIGGMFGGGKGVL